MFLNDLKALNPKHLSIHGIIHRSFKFIY